MVVTTLRDAGYTLLEARDGDEALRVCAEHPGQVDLILSDAVMPGLRGPEMIQRALELQPRARVIYISGYHEHEVVEDGMLSGAPLLVKPFNLKELQRQVRQELGARDSLSNASGLTTAGDRS
jgi:CheY-like chemotaxis protein